jgi:GxxExxY protein
MGNWKNLPHHEELTRHTNMMKNQFTEKKLLRQLILELKAVEEITGIHEAQILTYLKLAKLKTGLLINFNVPTLKQGIKRFVL